MEKEFDRWRKFRDALKKQEKEVFEKILNLSKRHVSEESDRPEPIPFRPILLSILLEQRKEIEELENRIEKLRNRRT